MSFYGDDYDDEGGGVEVGYVDEDGNFWPAEEVGARRGLRRFGRVLGAVATGGVSEMARAGARAARGKPALGYGGRQIQRAPAPMPMPVRFQPTPVRPVMPQTRPGALIPGSGRDVVLPLGSVGLSTGTPSGVLLVRSERPIQGERIILASSALDDFVVTAINVGVKLQQSAVGEMPARMFAHDAVGLNLELDPVGVGSAFSISLRYTGASATPIVLTGALRGPASD